MERRTRPLRAMHTVRRRYVAALRLCMIGRLCNFATAAISGRCQQLGENDALLIIDIQNSFMVERPVSGIPQYNLTGELTPNGTIPTGNLPVPRSNEVVPVLNSWFELRAAHGTAAAVFATLDYHPPKHCSFCLANEGGIEPFHGDGRISFCLRGIDTVDNFNDSHRCMDRISQRDYSTNAYFQFAEHGVAGTFGSRFDPFLDIPHDATVFKLGVNETADVYSAFDGGRLSLAPVGEHDTQPNSHDALADSSVTLSSELERRGVTRLFVMGLATDYTVGRTTEDALGINDENQDFKLAKGQVILVESASRAIIDARAETVRNRVASVATPTLEGNVLTSRDPADAMAELCANTCDTVDDCGSPRRYCSKHATFEWGVCTECRFVDGLGQVCAGHGVCNVDGGCDCDTGYSGVDCSDATGLVLILTFSIGGALVLVGLAAVAAARYFRRRFAHVLLLKATNAPPELSLEPGLKHHLFLSHVWATGQDQVAVIKRCVSALLHGANIFLDVDDLVDLSKLEESVQLSAVVLVFLSAGYFLSKNALREVEAAMKAQKPLILVHERNVAKGGAPIATLRDECPEHLRNYIFDSGNQITPWMRIGHFQIESLKLICAAMLLHSPKHKKEHERGRQVQLTVPGEITGIFWKADKRTLLYASPNNPGADVVADILCLVVHGLEVTSVFRLAGHPSESVLSRSRRSRILPNMLKLRQSPSRRVRTSLERDDLTAYGSVQATSEQSSSLSQARFLAGKVTESSAKKSFSLSIATAPSEQVSHHEPPTHMLLYLNSSTWLGTPGDVLAAEVRAAKKAGITIVMVHEHDEERGACDFSRFLTATPEDLVKNNLYGKDLATPWLSGPHGRVSRALVAKNLGAVADTSAARKIGSHMGSLRQRMTINFVRDSLSPNRAGSGQASQSATRKKDFFSTGEARCAAD